MSFDPRSFALSLKASGINTTAVKFTNGNPETVLQNGNDVTDLVILAEISEKRSEFLSQNFDVKNQIALSGGQSQRDINSRFD